MGMFDYIKDFEMKCPTCGEVVSGFQSKDGICALFELNYWEVDNFYTSCRKCQTWIEYERMGRKEQVPLSRYLMTSIKEAKR